MLENIITPKRRKIGLLIPATNTTLETDLALLAHKELSFHSHRLWFPQQVEDYNFVDNVNSHLEDASKYLKLAKVEIIVYGFTTGSFYKGLSYSYEISRRIENSTGLPAVIPALSILESLKCLGAKDISIATPYPEWHNKMFTKYLDEAGYNIIKLSGDTRSAEIAIKDPMWNQDPEEILKFCTAVFDQKADVLLCPCTGWRTFEVIKILEQKIGKPVITANQSLIWMAFKKLGITGGVSGYGKLLEDIV